MSRFVRAIAEQAALASRDLVAACSTRFQVPRAPNLINFAPRMAAAIPRYPQLELALPPCRAMLAWARRHAPHAVHVSTPGPVGLVGRAAARRLGVPLLGVYHTDFPAYVAHLFGDEALARGAAAFMRWFYRPFARVFVRSESYAGVVAALGIPRQRIVALRPGIDLEAFHPRFRDTSIWQRLGIPQDRVKVLYVGRISIEKNLPLLVRAWRLARPAAQLVVVGDGPYRAQMQRELAGLDVHFPGFRHGPELSAIYAGSDLFVFPSATDTLGQVVMEAQASGLPVLVSDTGGPMELVRPGTDGLVLPAHDAGAWAAALMKLVATDARRRAMGRAALEGAAGRSIRASFNHFWAAHEEAAALPGPSG